MSSNVPADRRAGARRGPTPPPKKSLRQRLSGVWLAAHPGRRPPRHPGLLRRSAVSEGPARAAGRAASATSSAPTSSCRRRTSSGTSIPRTRPDPSAIVIWHPSITSSILTTWLVIMVILAARLPRRPATLPTHAALAPERHRVRLRVARELRRLAGRPGARATSRCSRHSSCSSWFATGAGCCRSSAGSRSCVPPRAT